MILTEEQIKEINKKCPYNHGIFKQPYGIPVDVKEHVLYWRHETGGISGGNCWDDSNPEHYINTEPIPEFSALDKTLELLCPDISYLQYKKIEKLVHTNSETEREYYGNSTDWMIKYIKLSDLEKFLKENIVL